jgi:hypothetical protein
MVISSAINKSHTNQLTLLLLVAIVMFITTTTQLELKGDD